MPYFQNRDHMAHSKLSQAQWHKGTRDPRLLGLILGGVLVFWGGVFTIIFT